MNSSLCFSVSDTNIILLSSFKLNQKGKEEEEEEVEEEGLLCLLTIFTSPSGRDSVFEESRH
jgi:hypothetical protein